MCSPRCKIVQFKRGKSLNSCHQLSLLKKFDVGWDFASDPARGAYGAPPDVLSGFKGPDTDTEGGRKEREE